MTTKDNEKAFFDALLRMEKIEYSAPLTLREIEQIYFDVAVQKRPNPLIDFVRRIENAHGIGVKDAQSNYSTKNRVVRVRDTKKPGIYHLASRITNGMTINVQINEPFVDDIYALDTCNGTVTNFVKKPGYFGTKQRIVSLMQERLIQV